TAEEAAARLGCPRGTVLSRLARARDRLRAALSRRGVEASCGLLGAPLAAPAPPPALVADTVQRGLLFGAGAAGASSTVTARVKGVLPGMLFYRLTIAAGALVFLAASTGLGFLARQTTGAAQAQPAAKAPPAKGEETKAPAKTADA